MGLLGPITPGRHGRPGASRRHAAARRAGFRNAAQDPVRPVRRRLARNRLELAVRLRRRASRPRRTRTSNFPSDVDDAALYSAIASPDPQQQAAAQSACSSVTDTDLASRLRIRRVRHRRRWLRTAIRRRRRTSTTAASDRRRRDRRTPGSPPSQGAGGRREERRRDPGPRWAHNRSRQHPLRVDRHLIWCARTCWQSIQRLPRSVTRSSMRVVTDLYFAAGSVWACGQAPDCQRPVSARSRATTHDAGQTGRLPDPVHGH